MTNLARLLTLFLAMQILAARAGEDRVHKGLPIIYRAGGEAREVPIGTRRLAWKTEPLRELAPELLEPPRRGDDVIEDDLPEGDNDPIHARFRSHAIRSECFDLWIYGDLAVDKRMIWLLAALSSKIDLARDRGLTPADEEKLILAGTGDIKRFFDRVEDLRPDFESARGDIIEGHSFLRKLQSLSIEFQLGLFDFGSLFTKTLKKIENDRAQAKSR
jgi:hypothetical protein